MQRTFRVSFAASLPPPATSVSFLFHTKRALPVRKKEILKLTHPISATRRARSIFPQRLLFHRPAAASTHMTATQRAARDPPPLITASALVPPIRTHPLSLFFELHTHEHIVRVPQERGGLRARQVGRGDGGAAATPRRRPPSPLPSS